jgi:hypothetical protein
MNSSFIGNPASPCPPTGPSRRAVIKAATGAVGASGSAAFARWSRPRPIPAQQAAIAAGHSLVLAADQASERVILLNASDPSWQHVTPRVHDLHAAQALWSWSALDHEELSGLDPKRTWNLVSEAKYRLWNGAHWVLTCASDGLAAMVSYPDGQARWAGRTNANAHSLEVLPNGNIAVAASSQGFVRIYTASQSLLSDTYTQYDLPGAHGLQWDQARQLLWAAGTSGLVALAVSGTASRPRVTVERSVVPPSIGAHDLNAVASNPDRMWVTTYSHVYQYSISRNAFVPYTGEQGIDTPDMECISDDPLSGQVLTVVPDGKNPCEWCTSTLTFRLPNGTRHIAKTSLYKARWMPPLPTAGLRSSRKVSGL